MIRKYCPACEEDSYSASDLGEWICPYCGADLTYEPARQRDNGEVGL